MDASRLPLTFLFCTLLSTACDQTSRDDSGEIIDAGSMNVFNLRAGDCFDDASIDATSDEITGLPGLPCSEPHDNEVYAVFNSTLASYPSENEMYDIAFGQCLDRFNGFVGLPYEESELDIFTIYPTPGSWNLLQDREVVCAIYEMTGEKLSGSMLDSGR